MVRVLPAARWSGPGGRTWGFGMRNMGIVACASPKVLNTGGGGVRDRKHLGQLNLLRGFGRGRQGDDGNGSRASYSDR